MSNARAIMEARVRETKAILEGRTIKAQIEKFLQDVIDNESQGTKVQEQAVRLKVNLPENWQYNTFKPHIPFPDQRVRDMAADAVEQGTALVSKRSRETRQLVDEKAKKEVVYAKAREEAEARSGLKFAKDVLKIREAALEICQIYFAVGLAATRAETEFGFSMQALLDFIEARADAARLKAKEDAAKA